MRDFSPEAVSKLLKLVSLQEDAYQIEFAPHEIDAEHFDSIGQIVDLAVAKGA